MLATVAARPIRVLTVVVLSFSLAGCRQARAVRPSVKIGLVAPFEGQYRYVGYDVIYAVRLAIREANAVDGVAGYAIELVAYDDGGDPESAALQARKLDIDPQVLGVIGHFRERTTAAAVGEYDAAGLPILAPDVYGIDDLIGDGPVYVLAPPAELLANDILELALSSRPASVALVSSGGPIGAAIREAAEKRGLALDPIVGTGARELSQLVADDPTVVIVDVNPVGAGETVVALREAGWRGTVVGGPELSTSDFTAVAGASAAALCVTPWPFPQQLSGGQSFVEAYSEVSGGLPPGRLALPAYEAAWILIEAIALAIDEEGSPTRRSVARALDRVERKGVLGTISVGPGQYWQPDDLYRCESTNAALEP
jgi:branched-chain amino acid transport system substrate-binding protein